MPAARHPRVLRERGGPAGVRGVEEETGGKGCAEGRGQPEAKGLTEGQAGGAAHLPPLLFFCVELSLFFLTGGKGTDKERGIVIVVFR